MPILNKNNEYVIPITMKCNWKCSYCAINNKYDLNIKTDYDIVLNKIKKLPSSCICTITGGEPGLVSKDYILNYILLLKKKNIHIYLETNGLFIDRYPEFLKNFDEILYHCSEDLNDSFRYYELKNIRYILVITDSNIHKLNSYLLKNHRPNVKFDFIPASYPYNDEINGPILSNKNKITIISKYYNYMTKESIYRFFKDKDFNKINWLF